MYLPGHGCAGFGVGLGPLGAGDLVGGLDPVGPGAGAGHVAFKAGYTAVKGLASGCAGNGAVAAPALFL